MAGRVVHFEIPYDDADRAGKFYSDLFGWQLMPMPDMGYTMVMTGPSGDTGPSEAGFINGGMYEKSDQLRGVNIVIDVDDIDDKLREVENAGGKVALEKMQVGDMGYAAYFTDSEGNVVGLWQNA